MCCCSGFKYIRSLNALLSSIEEFSQFLSLVPPDSSCVILFVILRGHILTRSLCVPMGSF